MPVQDEAVSARAAGSNGSALRRNLVLLAAWLVIINLFALIAQNRLNLSPDTAFEWTRGEGFRPKPGWDLVDLHARWDSYWFLDIAEKGYYLRGERKQANVVFFPLYPLAVRFTGMFTGDLVLAGWIVSCLFLGLAIVALTRLTREFHPELDPRLPVVFLLAWPTAFQFNAVYSESLFLFLSLVVMLFARRGDFLAAGVFGALASSTRVAGIFLLVPVAIELVQARGWRALISWRAWPLALVPAGALAFFVYHWVAFDDFFLYLKVQGWWGWNFTAAPRSRVTNTAPNLTNTLIESGYALAVLVLAVYTGWKLRLSYGAYMLVTLAVAFTRAATFGIARYAMVLFPIYLVAAGIRSQTGRLAWLFASVLLLALHTTLFVNRYWSG
jgi:hypothetical protein